MSIDCAMLKLPIGLQSFASLRTDGFAYVDKTKLVYDLTHNGKYIFLSRPRRFGKSLLISTLKAYFQGKKELFEGLAISELEQTWESYPVLHLDLNVGIYNSVQGLQEALKSNLNIMEKRMVSQKKAMTTPSVSRSSFGMWLPKLANKSSSSWTRIRQAAH